MKNLQSYSDCDVSRAVRYRKTLRCEPAVRIVLDRRADLSRFGAPRGRRGGDPLIAAPAM